MKLVGPLTGGAIAASILAVIALVVSDAAATKGDLLRAMATGDRVTLEREAKAASARSLQLHLETGERTAMIAASLAAPLVSDAPLLIESLAVAANSPDRTVALHASRAALRILDDNERPRFAELEIDRALLADALRRWHEVARDTTRWADVRVIALEISRDLADLLANRSAPPLLEVFADPDPEVRAIAFQLLPDPLPSEHAERVANAVVNDKDDHVALAAAASLCGGLGFGDDSRAASLLGDRGRARVATLVLDVALAAPARLAAAHCLAGDRATLSKLAATMPPHLRDAARRVGSAK